MNTGARAISRADTPTEKLDTSKKLSKNAWFS
jgi:hypothetical protein